MLERGTGVGKGEGDIALGNLHRLGGKFVGSRLSLKFLNVSSGLLKRLHRQMQPPLPPIW